MGYFNETNSIEDAVFRISWKQQKAQTQGWGAAGAPAMLQQHLRPIRQITKAGTSLDWSFLSRERDGWCIKTHAEASPLPWQFER